MVPNNSLEQSGPSGWWLRSGPASSSPRWAGALRGGNMCCFLRSPAADGSGCAWLCPRVKLRANSDVPVAAPTSCCCCCWRSSPRFFPMFYCVTERVLCLAAGEDPPAQRSLAQASQGESRAANQLGVSGRFYGEGASLGPSIRPLSPFPLLGQRAFFANRDPFPSFIPQLEGPHGQVL